MKIKSNISKVLILSIGFVFFYILNTEKNSVEDFKDDVDFLFRNIEEIHPNIYANINKKDLEQEIVEIKNKITDSTSILDFFILVNPLVVKIKDGHTNLYFPKEYLFKKCGSSNKENIFFFPFSVKVNSKDLVVTIIHDFTEEKIPIGSDILSINGVGIREIIKKMFAQISGEKDFFKAEVLNPNFAYYLYAIYKDKDFKVKYKFKNKVDEKVFKGITLKKMLDNSKNKVSQKTKKYEPFSLKIDTLNSIAIFDFREFLYHKRFYKFLDSTFTKIKELKLKNIIIDVRSNGGGDSSLGDEFFQYISKVPFNQFGKILVKISKQSQKVYSSYADYSLGIKTYNPNKLIKLRENLLRFNGDIYLLQSHYTFSSAAGFTWAFKYFKMGTIIGEETGGLGTCFGDLIELCLPNTELVFSVSHKKFYQYGATDIDTHGTIPDYEIKADDALDFAIKMIKEKNK